MWPKVEDDILQTIYSVSQKSGPLKLFAIFSLMFSIFV